MFPAGCFEGNVFADLGFGKETAENLRLRADLMIELREVIQRKRLTQAQATKLFRVSQPRISDAYRRCLKRRESMLGNCISMRRIHDVAQLIILQRSRLLILGSACVNRCSFMVRRQ